MNIYIATLSEYLHSVEKNVLIVSNRNLIKILDETFYNSIKLVSIKDIPVKELRLLF